MLPLCLLQAATSDPNSRMIAIATVIIAAATVIYVVATILLWWTTKQSVDITRRLFNLSQRPLIGAKVARRINLKKPERIQFGITFTNAGTVSAHDVWTSLRIIIDGNFLPEKSPGYEENFILLPNQVMEVMATVDEPQDLASVKTASVLALLFKCTYKGPTEEEYHYEQKYAYDVIAGEFATVRTTITIP